MAKWHKIRKDKSDRALLTVLLFSCRMNLTLLTLILYGAYSARKELVNRHEASEVD